MDDPFSWRYEENRAANSKVVNKSQPTLYKCPSCGAVQSFPSGTKIPCGNCGFPAMVALHPTREATRDHGERRCHCGAPVYYYSSHESRWRHDAQTCNNPQCLPVSFPSSAQYGTKDFQEQGTPHHESAYFGYRSNKDLTARNHAHGQASSYQALATSLRPYYYQVSDSETRTQSSRGISTTSTNPYRRREHASTYSPDPTDCIESTKSSTFATAASYAGVGVVGIGVRIRIAGSALESASRR